MGFKIFFLFSFLLIASCTQNESKSSDTTSEIDHEEAGTKVKPEEYNVISIQNPDQSWGYQIMKDGKIIIDQKHIPAIQGNLGFRTMEDAEKTGNFIVNKIKNGGFPPTISTEELDSLGVL